MSQDHPTPDPRHEPIDPDTLPDPEDITEDDLGPAPARPQTRRRFAGTRQQIRGAKTFYKVCAWITGVMLLLLVAEMIAKYGFGNEIFAGGVTADGVENTVGFHPEDSVTGGVNLSSAILIAHGWMYVVYLFAGFRVWNFMRWNPLRLFLMAGGGVVPFLSFIVEKKIDRDVEAELHRFPDAALRY
ncbi:DUF3817 domain-containing protein [Micrococcus lylae]|uniref:DUF3817 domain-containing protein n=1 Tax=Micrococcus lylae TaxID=1273 RepID=UPI000C80C731|nr:DUF3817 domain-containing protein [Micrococcus lylae]WIK81153.1 DUF3817 domain-containing protein [Micrococcus lylae]